MCGSWNAKRSIKFHVRAEISKCKDLPSLQKKTVLIIGSAVHRYEAYILQIRCIIMDGIKDERLRHDGLESFSADGDWDVQKKRSPLVMVGTTVTLTQWYYIDAK